MNIEIYLALEEKYQQKIKEATSKIEKLLEDPNEVVISDLEEQVREISQTENDIRTLKKIFGE